MQGTGLTEKAGTVGGWEGGGGGRRGVGRGGGGCREQGSLRKRERWVAGRGVEAGGGESGGGGGGGGARMGSRGKVYYA